MSLEMKPRWRIDLLNCHTASLRDNDNALIEGCADWGGGEYTVFVTPT